MAQFEFEGVQFDSPDGWQERTVVSFVASARPDDQYAPRVTLTREVRRDGDSLGAHVQRQLIALAAVLRELEMVDSEEVEIAGRRAHQTRCTWRDDSGVVDQLVVYLEPEPGNRGVVTVTCTARLEAASTVRPVFERMLAAIRVTGSAPRATQVPPSYPPAFQAPESTIVPMPGVRVRR